MKQCKKDLLLSMILPKSAESARKDAKKFAERFKDEKLFM